MKPPLKSPVKSPFRLFSNSITIGIWTFISRISGLAREIIFAALFGSSAVAEAFQIAFTLPNLFRQIFAEGAFSSAFIPMFAKKKGQKAEIFVSEIWAVLGAALIVLCLLAMVVMPWLILGMAGGFGSDGRLALATDFGRITFAYIIFISLATLLGGILQSSARFGVVAATPICLNVILCAAMVFAPRFGVAAERALVWGVPLAGIVQLMLVWVFVRRLGFRVRWQWPRITEDVKRLFWIALPTALAASVLQINLIIGRFVASYEPGAIQWLAMSNRLYQFPIGLVGISISVALLPSLSFAVQNNDAGRVRDNFNRAVELSLFFILPSMVALVLIALPLNSVVFERGALVRSDSVSAAWALQIYALGLPAIALQKLCLTLYFAYQNTKTPMRFSLVSVAINAGFALGLSPYFGFLAAAIGATVASWALVGCLWFWMRWQGWQAARLDSRTRGQIGRIIVASVVMGAVLYGVNIALDEALFNAGWRYLALAGVIFAGGISYLGMCWILGVFRLEQIKSVLKR